jgi:hypothetical protein
LGVFYILGAFAVLHSLPTAHRPWPPAGGNVPVLLCVARKKGEKIHVVSSYFKCFGYFRGALQAFHMDVIKVDQDIVDVAMVVHVCCKSMSLMFHLFF